MVTEDVWVDGVWVMDASRGKALEKEETTVEKLILVTASWDNSLRAWDVESASLLSVFRDIHTMPIFDVSLVVSRFRVRLHKETRVSCSMLRCITVGRDSSVKLWNFEIGSLERKIKVHSREIRRSRSDLPF